jgi:5-methylcytosine-specific restriction endonuclease McrA
VACTRADYRRRELGRPPLQKAIYSSTEYKRLRAIVMDGAFACAHCGATGVPLTCDHVRSIESAPHLALSLENLVPSCRSCQERRKLRSHTP